MRTLPCGHVAYASSVRACVHLADPAQEEMPHVRLLTGRRLEYNLACGDCDAAGQQVSLVEICEGCVGRHADNAHDGSLRAWRGRPGRAERPEPLDQTIQRWRLPGQVRDAIDLIPYGTGDASTWLVLTTDGRVAAIDPDADSYAVLATVTPIPEPDHRPWAGHRLRRRLHASACGRFAAVVHDYGRHGTVVDLTRSGTTTMLLDGGTYYPETVPFSLTFAEHDGRPVVVHRTAWNRLDVSDPQTGQLLTARTHAPTDPEQRPEHALDYFHGRLLLSPDGRWLADDGWVWSPVGMPVIWDLNRWLDSNPWESEDGHSRRRLCWRAYYWDRPICFVGEDLLAVDGIGYDDEVMLSGVRVFSVATGAEVTAFAGPTGDLFSDGHRLYSAEQDALQIWDPATGHHTGTVPGFVPTRHHRSTGELATTAGGVLQRWRTGREARATPNRVPGSADPIASAATQDDTNGD